MGNAMNRFIQRLAARSLGALPVLTPRRASRYEAAAASALPEERAEIAPPPLAAPPQPLPPPAPPTASEAVPAAREQPRVKAREPMPTPATVVVIRQTLEGLPGPEILVPAPPQAPLPAVAAQGGREVAAQPGETIVLEREAVVERLLLERNIHEVRSLLVPPGVREPVLAPTRRPGGAQPLPPSQAAPREEVHITIGRVEIRGLPPQAAQPRPREAAPSKLDGYLQQRGRRTS